MSDTSPFGFGRFVPGFDFLQKLSEGAAASLPTMPPMAGWVAPTMSVPEIDQRIRELKTVQFWLEQNVRALNATVQALEVQRMTLATLQGMNVAMTDLASGAFRAAPAAPAEPAGPAPAAAPEPPSAAPAPQPEPEAPADTAAPAPPSTVTDPLQWWGALTQQFQEIAAKAMGDASAQQAALKAASAVASSMLPKATGTAARTAAPRKKAAAKKSAARKPRRGA